MDVGAFCGNHADVIPTGLENRRRFSTTPTGPAATGSNDGIREEGEDQGQGLKTSRPRPQDRKADPNQGIRPNQGKEKRGEF